MLSILYVDDEQELLDLGKIFLERIGKFTLDTADSAGAGLEKLKINHYDAIVSDYLMPEMDGIEFLKEVRSQYGNIPFILFTGKGREEVAIMALNSGADFYLQKGGDPVAEFIELKNKLEKSIHEFQMEVALQNSERRLTDIIDFLPDATFAIDLTGKVILWNKAIEEMTGVLAENILGKGDYEYAIPFYGERRPILIDLVLTPSQEIKQKYTDIVYNGNAIEAKPALPHQDGIPTILWTKASPLYNQDNQIIGAIESIRDISDKEEYEHRFSESAERNQTLVESFHDAVYIIDKDDRIVYVNPAGSEKLGFPKDQIIGKPRSQFFSASVNESQYSNLQKVFATGEPLHIESSTPFKDNDRQDTQFIPIRDKSGIVVEVMGVSRELISRNNTE